MGGSEYSGGGGGRGGGTGGCRGTGRDKPADLNLYDSGDAQDLPTGNAIFSLHGATALSRPGTPHFRGFPITHI
jgi:hypothetical protein